MRKLIKNLEKKLRYENARNIFIQTIRNNGDGTAYAEVEREYKQASDDYHKLKGDPNDYKKRS